MAIVNESSYHGYINLVLNRKIERENLSFHILLPITLFPKIIQSDFILILPFKKIEMTIGCVNYIRQYQLNFN